MVITAKFQSLSPHSPHGPHGPLGSRGQIYVTLAAAQRYAQQEDLRPEEARRELTELLLDAKVQEEGPPMRCRARSRTSQVDITAQVVPEGRLLVVVAVNSRGYR